MAVFHKAQLFGVILLAFSACEPAERRTTRAQDRQARLGGESSSTATPRVQSGEGTVNDDEDDVRPFSPVGTRAEALRCQAALGSAADYFSPDWYTYSDRDNPDTSVDGCDVGMSASLLEALAWGEGRTNLCAIRWIVDIQRAARYPYVGMGVRLATGNADKLSKMREIVIETRSTKPVTMDAQLLMVDQENMDCGDERKSPYGHAITCDGTGAWTKQTIRVADMNAPAWGKPPPFSQARAIALHFHMGPESVGHHECDIRILEVR